MAWTALDHAIAALKNPSTRQGDIPRLAREILTEYGRELADMIEADTTATGEANDQYAVIYAGLIRSHDPKGA